MKQIRFAIQLMLMCVVCLGTAACEKSSVQTGNDYAPPIRGKVDDSILTTKVKLALANDETVKSLNISVTTNDGVVTLTGNVDSQEQMDMSVALARQVEGVKKVVSRMALEKTPAQVSH